MYDTTCIFFKKTILSLYYCSKIVCFYSWLQLQLLWLRIDIYCLKVLLRRKLDFVTMRMVINHFKPLISNNEVYLKKKIIVVRKGGYIKSI